MKKRKTDNKVRNGFLILLRYLILLGLMFSLPLFYKILTPMTLYSTGGLLKLFFQEVIVYSEIHMILINSLKYIEIIPACVAGSAYLLLLILNLSVSMDYLKRIKSILLSFILLFALNVIRIVFLALLYQESSVFFNIVHKLYWYVLSTVFVVLIWFLMVKVFSIEEVPFYSDLKVLIKNIKSSRA